MTRRAGRPRNSTIVLVAVFLVTFVLYFWVLRFDRVAERDADGRLLGYRAPTAQEVVAIQERQREERAEQEGDGATEPGGRGDPDTPPTEEGESEADTDDEVPTGEEPVTTTTAPVPPPGQTTTTTAPATTTTTAAPTTTTAPPVESPGGDGTDAGTG
jgi:hypothetical protein